VAYQVDVFGRHRLRARPVLVMRLRSRMQLLNRLTVLAQEARDPVRVHGALVRDHMCVATNLT
jgi:hypothetical protein